MKEITDESYLTLFSRHKFSCYFIFSLLSCLLLFRLLFSLCLLSVTVFLLCLSLSLSVSLCPCDVACFVVCDVVCGSAHVVSVCICACGCVCVCVSLCVTAVCPLNTSPCTLKTSTRGRVEWTHAEGRESSSVLLTKICPQSVITCFRDPPKEALGSFPFFKF